MFIEKNKEEGNIRVIQLNFIGLSEKHYSTVNVISEYREMSKNYLKNNPPQNYPSSYFA